MLQTVPSSQVMMSLSALTENCTIKTEGKQCGANRNRTLHYMAAGPQSFKAQRAFEGVREGCNEEINERPLPISCVR